MPLLSSGSNAILVLTIAVADSDTVDSFAPPNTAADLTLSASSATKELTEAMPMPGLFWKINGKFWVGLRHQQHLQQNNSVDK